MLKQWTTKAGCASSRPWTGRALIAVAISSGTFVAGCLSGADYTEGGGQSLPGQGANQGASGGAAVPGGMTANGGSTAAAGTSPAANAGTSTTATAGTSTTSTAGTSTAGSGIDTAGSGGVDTTGIGGTSMIAGAGGAAAGAAGMGAAAGGATMGGTGAEPAGGAPSAGVGGSEGAAASAGTGGTEPTGPTYMCDDMMVACANGKAGEKDCSGINQLAYLDGPSLQGGDGNDIWGWTDSMTGKEYALVGLSNGTAFVDVSDPCRPVHLGHLRTQTVNELWRDVKVYKDHAYIVAESQGHGMQVFDLTQLRNVTNPPVTFEPTTVVDTFGSAHNLAIDVQTGFAYPQSTNNCPDGRSIDLADPENPVDLGCWNSGSRTHDALCLIYNGPDESFAGKEVCITGSESRGLFVYDLSDKSNVPVVSQTRYPNLTYAHQVWLTEDHHYLMLTDESDELDTGINMTINIFDMSNLAAPVHIGQYVSPMENSDHQIYVRGNYAFLSAYSAGLRVFDISNIAQGELVEVGYFDTYPQHNNAGYDGQWSVYPYFKSGVLITNGIVMGLHVLEPDPQWLQPSQWMGW